MFFLGLLVGALVVLALGTWAWFWFGGGSSPSLYEARAAIRAQERQTIHDLFAAEQSMRRASPMAGSDIIEGTAVEVDRP